MQQNQNGELILGTAMGYDFDNLKPFLYSLKNTGYKGDICLFISNVNRKTCISLNEQDIKLIPFCEKYPFTKRLKIPPNSLPKSLCRRISVKYLRYILYYLFLKKYEDKYSKILLTDVRDVIFQRNPFDFDLNNGLCCFYEDTHTTIKNSPFNSIRIKRHFGDKVLEEIGGNYPLCSGTTYGFFQDILKYLERMIQILPEIEPIGGGDQGIHNYLIYHNQLPNVTFYNNEEGPVFTFGTKISNSISINKEGYIVNKNDEVFNIIHQYDRHPELFDKLSIHHKVRMPLHLPRVLYKIILPIKNRIENRMGLDIVNQVIFKIANKTGLTITLDRLHLL